MHLISINNNIHNNAVADVRKRIYILLLNASYLIALVQVSTALLILDCV